MQKPDFSTYSEAQLRQVLARLDADRFPERLQEIQALLAIKVATASPVAHAPAPMTIAGVRLRFIAFWIDIFVLGIIGFVASLVFSEQFTAMGERGRLVGFCVALVYFGLAESRFGGGASIGKRLVKLRVVSRTGLALHAPAALARVAIFSFAYFLNNTGWRMPDPTDPVAIGRSMLVSAMSLSLWYLLIFNRRTRQSIHDLATGAFVVTDGSAGFAPPARPVWRGHLAIIAAILLIGSAAAIAWLHESPAQPMLATYKAIVKLPGVQRASIAETTLYFDGTRRDALMIDAIVDPSVTPGAPLEDQIAQRALATYADFPAQESITVTLVRGYDIGIASSWSGTRYDLTAAQWQARVAGARP